MSGIEIKSVTEENIRDAAEVFNRFAAVVPNWFKVDIASFWRDVFEGARTLHDVPFPFEPDACLVGYADGRARGFIHAGIAPRLGTKGHEDRTRGKNAVIRCFLFDEECAELGERMLGRVLDFFKTQKPDRMIAFEGELGYPNMSGGAGYCWAGLKHVISLLEKNRFKESFRFAWHEKRAGGEKAVEPPPGVIVRREREHFGPGEFLKYTMSRDEEDVSMCVVALMRELAVEAGVGQAYIYNNTTFPAHRRKGYAKTLTQYVIADLGRFAIKRLFTLVPVDNLTARRLYESVGFDAGEECIEFEK